MTQRQYNLIHDHPYEGPVEQSRQNFVRKTRVPATSPALRMAPAGVLPADRGKALMDALQG